MVVFGAALSNRWINSYNFSRLLSLLIIQHMKILRFIILCLPLWSIAQPGLIQGAWQLTGQGDPGETAMMIVADQYMAIAVYNETHPQFIRTYGGSYRIEGGKCILRLDFDTKDTTAIGTDIPYNMTLAGNKLTLEHQAKVTWTRVDEGAAPLAGCWRITARAGNDGNMNPMQPGPRKTLKINSATRFQWVAINPSTKQFFGTGGGKYTFSDGKYTEFIGFFSRDNSRVGSQLAFDARVGEGKWYHSGKSSTGNPINELWEKQ